MLAVCMCLTIISVLINIVNLSGCLKLVKKFVSLSSVYGVMIVTYLKFNSYNRNSIVN